MAILIDIENASGLRYGEGPIATAIEWNAVRRLDAAGTFSFSMPASDPRSNLCQAKRIAHCYTYENGIRKDVGAGVIDVITVEPQAEGPTLIRVAGDDLLRELVNIQVAELELFDRDIEAPAYLTMEPGGNITPPVWITLYHDAGGNAFNFLYLKCTEAFDNATVDIGSGGGPGSTLVAQFYNSETTAWEGLTLEDGTYASNGTLNQDGTISWSIPDNWGTIDDLYQMRFHQEGRGDCTVLINSLTVEFKRPFYDAIRKTMLLAPEAWTLDLTGKLVTESPLYLQMTGESILATLIRIAEQTGEHFILSPAGRRVRWIGTEKDSSGLIAMAAGNQIGAQNPYALQIVSVEQSSDSYDLCTRIFPYGAGVEGARLTLAEATDEAPAGYIIYKPNNVLRHIKAEAEYGRIDWTQDFPDIAPLDISLTSVQNASNQLLKRAYEVLRRKAEVNKTYSLSVLPSTYEVWPGQTIECVYHEWEDNFHVIDIDTTETGLPLWVMETEAQIDATGTRVVGLTVAIVDKLADSSSFMVANSLTQLNQARKLEIPESGLSDGGGPTSSVVSNLTVKNGRVVAVRRETAIADGQYSSVDIIRIRNGVIVAINP